MSELSSTTQEKILEAQTAYGVPSDQPMVPYRNIGALLEEQSDKYEQKPFLIFYSDDGHRKEFSYREFFEEVCRTAQYLHECGIGHGDRIATVSFNHSDVVVQCGRG
jgi:acyl-CoA synthetase (AMP-forming)/AMP-acid ligase II